MTIPKGSRAILTAISDYLQNPSEQNSNTVTDVCTTYSNYIDTSLGGFTPLGRAAHSNDIFLIALLIAQGANPTIPGNSAGNSIEEILSTHTENQTPGNTENNNVILEQFFPQPLAQTMQQYTMNNLEFFQHLTSN